MPWLFTHAENYRGAIGWAINRGMSRREALADPPGMSVLDLNMPALTQRLDYIFRAQILGSQKLTRKLMAPT